MRKEANALYRFSPLVRKLREVHIILFSRTEHGNVINLILCQEANKSIIT